MKKYILLIFITLFFTEVFSQNILEKGRISGYMFGDYFYNATRDTGISNMKDVVNGGEKNLNGFQFRRIYLTYDNDISEQFVAKFRIEADQEANTNNGKIGIQVKDAFLTWKDIFKGSDLTFGIQPTPSFEASEYIWGRRYLEKTILDLRGIVSSRDIALSLRGKTDNEGFFKYWFMIGNGNGNRPEFDKYKRFYATLQFSFSKEFIMTLGGDYHTRAKTSYSMFPGQTFENNEFTISGFLGYLKKNEFSLGIETFINQRENSIISGGELKNNQKFGVSTFGSYSFNNKFSLAGRFDFFNPNFNIDNAKNSRNLILIAFEYNPISKVTISPNVLIETYQTDANGREYTPSTTARLTINYIFL
ncbi:MAG TPA: porin [Ignavibacteria bacterium]|nr:porin [Ignavibacteria bacterium]